MVIPPIPDFFLKKRKILEVFSNLLAKTFFDMGEEGGKDSFPLICLEKQLNYFCPIKEKKLKKTESYTSVGNCMQCSRTKYNHLENNIYDRKSIGQA